MVLLAGQVGQFALELEVVPVVPGIDCSRCQRFLDGALGLGLVPAVVKATTLGQHLDVGKRRPQTIVALPQRNLPEARRIDEQSPLGQDDQLSVSGGMAPATVMLADVLHHHDLLTGQTIDDGRLAHSGGADQGDRRAGLDVGGELLQPLAGHGTQFVHRNAWRYRLRRCQVLVGLRTQIGLVEQQHRLRAAIPDQGEGALDAA